MKNTMIGRLLETLWRGRSAGSPRDLGLDRGDGRREENPSQDERERAAPDAETRVEFDSTRQHPRTPGYSRLTSVGGMPRVLRAQTKRDESTRRSAWAMSRANPEASARIKAVDAAIAGWVNPKSRKGR